MASVKDHAHKLNARSLRKLQHELDAQRDMERMHLQTIRTEKVRLQKELEKVRLKGQYLIGRKPPLAKPTKLLQGRFSEQKPIDATQSLNIDNRPRSRLLSRSPSSPSASRKEFNFHKDTIPALDLETGFYQLNSIGSDDEDFPLEVEYRKRAKDVDNFVNRKQHAQEKHRNNLKEERIEISARVEEFSKSLAPRSPRLTSQTEDVSFEEIISFGGDKQSSLSRHSGGSTRSGNSSTKPARKKSRQMSIADYDVNQAKTSVAKRLLLIGVDDIVKSTDHMTSNQSSKIPNDKIPPPLSKRETFRRRSTQVAILDREQVNKYAPVEQNDKSDEEELDAEVRKVTAGNTQPISEKGSQLQLNFSGVGANTKRKVLEIIENPELQFDEETYAPDGSLRTVHMLPPAEEAFAEAGKARYLRWRDPQNLERERELSVGEIFAKDSLGNYRRDSNDYV